MFGGHKFRIEVWRSAILVSLGEAHLCHFKSAVPPGVPGLVATSPGSLPPLSCVHLPTLLSQVPLASLL